ncbi:MAG: indole-3-glycerol phosphate synthase TrpC [Bacteroidales bacterium]|nr:indole-3-glycerol phosphate synthase TrpC [Bacteroidales bacterium]
MNILEEIIAHKRIEVAAKKKIITQDSLEKYEYFKASRPSFYNALSAPGPSIIGEFKRMSPSKGIINSFVEIEQVARGYEAAGLSAMSILTDIEFFGGDENDLQEVAAYSSLPLLRKDFTVDEYQIIEAKAIGASAILLIAAVLTKKEINKFTNLADSLGLDVLCEIHDPSELEKLCPKNNILGINNRNLKTFAMDIGHSQDLIRSLPESSLKVAESGLSDQEEVKLLYETGFDAFLIGENFMRNQDPGKTAEKFVKGLKQIIK